MTDSTWFDLSQEGKEIWNQNAPFWDDAFGEGNQFQKYLIGPATEHLLDLKPAEQVLDAACGNGHFARRMAALGAQVVAFDFSESFIERARQRTKENIERIEYHVIDATDKPSMLALGENRFDAAVCTMAMMDMAAVEPLLEALSKLLKPDGRFVFSIQHPCFNNSHILRLIEEEDRNGELITSYNLKITRYITPSITKGLGIIGQPVPHHYFHRPLSMILQKCFQAGFILDGMEEPVFSAEAQPSRPFSWVNFAEIPPVLVVRLRLKPR